MRPEHEIRADYDNDSIVVYQAYSKSIALPALQKGRFVEPFSFSRMTWIRPSILWLMHRSNWARKSGQEHILAVRITKKGWEHALTCGVLTAYEAEAHSSKLQWADDFAKAKVHVQWDPERSIRGAALPYGSIQVGISREMIREFNEKWIIGIADLSPLVAKTRELLRRGEVQAASKHLPPERPYEVPAKVGKHLLMS
jgi:hypothetical protein